MRSTVFSMGAGAVATTPLNPTLESGPSRPPDFEAESRALGELAGELADNPQGVLQRLVEKALKLCDAESAGLSILESDGGSEYFRWHVTAGVIAARKGERLPRAASPCGVVLTSGTALLFRRPALHFPVFSDLRPPVLESLLVPFYSRGKPIGTLWVSNHTSGRTFDAETARILTSLAGFASGAYQMTVTLDAAENSRKELESRLEARTQELFETNECLRREIEERKQTEGKLRRREEFHRLAVEAGHIGTWDLVVDSQECLISPEMAELMGFPPGQTSASKQEWLNAIIPEDRHSTAVALSRAVKSNAPFELEFRVDLGDGRRRSLYSRGAVTRDKSGKSRWIHGASIDMTERRHLERALLEAAEREQRRIGQDLHDGLCQTLSGISLMVAVLARGMKAGKVVSTKELQTLAEYLSHAVDEGRNIARGFYPVELDKGGIRAALETIVSSVTHAVSCALHCKGPLPKIDRITALHLYRIAQEAVQNAVRHASPKRIDISLYAAGQEIILEIEDDGCGFDPARVVQGSGSIGLASMRYRASAIGAVFSVTSKRRHGTVVCCSIPQAYSVPQTLKRRPRRQTP